VVRKENCKHSKGNISPLAESPPKEQAEIINYAIVLTIEL